MSRDNHYLLGNKFAVGAEPNRTAFKKGSVPWNKGRHLPTSEKCLATTFKKGLTQHNYLSLGTLTLRIDKSRRQRRWIKTEKGWVIFAQYLWEKRHGAIPRGLLVHHLDGDPLNDCLSNYALVTRAQHINVHRAGLARKTAR